MKIPCPPFSIYSCWFPAIFAERFPELDIETTSFCLITFNGGMFINLLNYIFNTFMLSSSITFCRNEIHNLIRGCLKKYLPLFVLSLIDNFMMCLYSKKWWLIVPYLCLHAICVEYLIYCYVSFYIFNILLYIFYIPLWFSSLFSKGSTSI